MPRRSSGHRAEQCREAEGLKPRDDPEGYPWPESTVLGILRNPRWAGYSVSSDVRDRRTLVTANTKKTELEAQKVELVLAVRGKRWGYRDLALIHR